VHKARDQKWVPRDYKAKEGGKEEEVRDLEKVEREEKRLWGEALRLGRISWGEAVVCWVHVLALRVFVETVLRYGLPLEFVCGLVKVRIYYLIFFVGEGLSEGRGREVYKAGWGVLLTRRIHRQRPNLQRKLAIPSTSNTPTLLATLSDATRRGELQRTIRPPRRICRLRGIWVRGETTLRMCAMSLRLNEAGALRWERVGVGVGAGKCGSGCRCT